MKKVVSLILCCVLLCPVFSTAAEVTEESTSAQGETLLPCEATVEDDFITGEIMVGIKSAYSVVNKVWTAADFPELSGITEIEDLTYAETKEVVEKFSAKENFHQLLKIAISNTAKSAVIAGIDALEQNNKLLFAEPNFKIELPELKPSNHSVIPFANNLSLNNSNRYKKYTNDPDLLRQHGIFVHNIDKAWNAFTVGSKSVTVGVFDTGVYGHADLLTNLTLGYDCINDVKCTNYSYTRNHGTGVASIIGADGNNGIYMAGVCHDVTIYPFIVVNKNDADNENCITYIARGLLKAAALDIPIINLSLNTYYMNNNLVTNAAKVYDGLIVIAAGNDGEKITSTNHYAPIIDMSNTIVVGGINKDLEVWSNSNYSSTYVDIMALANEALACSSPLEGVVCKEWAGTSVAAPFVSGVAALLLSYDSTLTTAQLKQYILDGAQTSSSLTNYCVNGRYLDAYGAFLAMKGQQATCVNLAILAKKDVVSYSFEVYHVERYDRLSEILIPTTVENKIKSLSIETTDDTITVNMELYFSQTTNTPLIEFHFISYDTLTYAKAYLGLTTLGMTNSSGSAVSGTVTGKTLLVGDANGDGAVNVADTQLIMRYVSDSSLIKGNNLLAADVNGDFVVNAADALRISNYSVSKLLSFY